MARFTTTVPSTKSPEEAFQYMADLRNFSQWDRQITKVEQINGDGPGINTVFDITVRAMGGRPMTLRYHVTEFESPTSLLLEARNTFFTSIDRIIITPTATGCDVTYDAILTANWIISPMNLFLSATFNKAGESATKGLRKVLA